MSAVDSSQPIASRTSVLGKRSAGSGSIEALDKRPLKRSDTGCSSVEKVACTVQFVSKPLIKGINSGPPAFGVQCTNPVRSFKVSKSGGQGDVGFTFSRSRSPIAIKKYEYKEDFKVEERALRQSSGAAHAVFFRGTAKQERSGENVLLMDKVEGKNLQEILRLKSTSFNEADVLRLIKNILECLRDLEPKDIVHCDIKPGNIISDEQNKQFVLVDFACSSVDREGGGDGGTYGYYSPQRCLRYENDHTDDIWSLGCVAFEAYSKTLLLSGPEPESSDEVFRKSLSKIENLIGEVPESLITDSWDDITEEREESEISKGESLDDRIKDFPDSLKTLIKSMLSYERPTAKELLKNQYLQEDIGIRLDYPPYFERKKYRLVIGPKEPLEGGILPKDSVTFSLEKQSRKICHHVPRSQDGRYEVKLINSEGHIVFFRADLEMHENGTLSFLV